MQQTGRTIGVKQVESHCIVKHQSSPAEVHCKQFSALIVGWLKKSEVESRKKPKSNRRAEQFLRVLMSHFAFSISNICVLPSGTQQMVMPILLLR